MLPAFKIYFPKEPPPHVSSNVRKLDETIEIRTIFLIFIEDHQPCNINLLWEAQLYKKAI